MKIEGPYSIPSSWVWVKLGDITQELESGGRPRGGARGITEGVPSIGAEHLDNRGGFDFKRMRYVPSPFAESMRRGRVRKGDILIVKDGATTGKTSFVDPRFPYPNAVLNEHVFRLRVFSKAATQDYVFRFLFGPVGQRMIRDGFRGSAQGGINQGFVDFVRIPLAPIQEQERIISRIEDALSRMRLVRGTLQKVPAILRRFRQSMLTKTFRGENIKRIAPEELAPEIKERIHRDAWQRFSSEELPQLPPSWIWTAVGRLLREPLRNGKSALPAKSPDKGIPVLRLSAITFNDFGSSNVKLCDLRKEDVQDLWVKTNDILIARSNTIEYVGMGSLYEGPSDKFVFPDLMIRARVDEKIASPRFLAFYLNSGFARDYFRRHAGGTAGSMPKISQDDIMQLPVPLAPLGVQQQIVKRIGEMHSLAKRAEEYVEESLRQTEISERAILSRAFRGELVPQDQSDRPMQDFLERITLENKRQESASRITNAFGK